MNQQIERIPYDRLISLATGAVRKVDDQGPRGITLCSIEEIEALAGVAALSGLLPVPEPKSVNETPMFKSRRAKK